MKQDLFESERTKLLLWTCSGLIVSATAGWYVPYGLVEILHLAFNAPF